MLPIPIYREVFLCFVILFQKKDILRMLKMPMKYIILYFLLPATCFSQWISLHSPQFSEITVTGNNIFGSEADLGIYLSTNNGVNWSLTSLNTPGFNKISAEGTNIFVGTEQTAGLRGVYRSTNSGINWSKVLSISEIYSVRAITINGNNIYASTGWKIYRSINNGNNWTEALNSFFTYSIAVSPINPNTIFAAAEAGGVYISTNNGINWTQTSLGNINTLSVKASGSNIFAGTDAGVFLSTNNGSTWNPTSLDTRRYVSSLTISGANIFAGTDYGVYFSSNNGAVWFQKNQGLAGNISDGPHLCSTENFIFATNEGTSSFRRDLSEIININQISTVIPKGFSLSQNYPNPFNPATKINFSLPYSSNVILKVFDITGKEIALLINEIFNSGTYEYFFNAESFSSGIYFYRLDAENFSETKRMMLIK